MEPTKDNTTGTAEFDDFEDREPDDCYCESTYTPLSEFDHFFQEGYPQALTQKQKTAEKMKSSGDLSEIKSTVRKFIKPSGEIRLPDPEHQRIKYGKRTPKEYTNDSYKKAYEYVKPIYNEFVDSQQISPGHNRSAKKQLFDICGIKDPDQHVIVIPDHKWGNDISFSIIKKKQCHLYKVTKNTRFIHFSDNQLSSLIPTCKSRPFNGHCYIYPTSRCYFWAIEGTPSLAMVQYAHLTYGDEIYEYKPKATDKFYIDQSDSNRYPNCTPVFIETKDSLSVTKVTNIVDDSFFQEYTSSKQRNRQKKFLKEKNFVPDKNNPKKGTIDSTEIDPKTGKPIRVQFSYDNEKMDNHDANARGTDFIHMSERILKQHPDVSKSSFAHEDGHLMAKRNPERFISEIEKISKSLDASGLRSVMNEHGNSAEEYFADKNSLDKVGYDATVRMLKKAYEPKDIGYDKRRKAIKKDPYNYLLSQLSYDSKNAINILGTEGMELLGITSSEDMFKREIIRYKNSIKREIAFKRRLIQDKEFNDDFDKFISNRIEFCKKTIAELEEKINISKNERKKLHEKLKTQLSDFHSDKNQLIKNLLDGVDEVEKANNAERDFRIKMLSLWNKGDDTVKEGCDNMPLSEFDHYFQEAKMKAKTRKELDDSDFALVYKDASGNKIRKYPINDEAHVKAAARMFPRGVPNKYRKEVAGKILRRAHKFGIDTSGWKSLNAANEKD